MGVKSKTLDLTSILFSAIIELVMNEKVRLIRVDIDWVPVAKEAIEGCPKIKKEREKHIVLARFGIFGKTKTLQAIGDQYKITRERVRQIINNSLKKISESYLDNKRVKEAVKLIERTIKENGGYESLDTLTKKLTSGDSKQKNALRFLASLSDNINNIKDSGRLREGWRTKSISQKQLEKAGEKAILFLEEKKESQSSKEISKKTKTEERLVGCSLSANKEAVKTADGKWGLVSWPHINPKNIRDRSKYIIKKHGKPIHYSDLAEKMTELGGKGVTKQSVHNELIKNKDFVLVGQGIYALSEWGYKPGAVEEVIINTLMEAGKPLHKEKIIEQVLKKRIVKSDTVALNLQKPKFRKLGKSIYTLSQEQDA